MIHAAGMKDFAFDRGLKHFWVRRNFQYQKGREDLFNNFVNCSEKYPNISILYIVFIFRKSFLCFSQKHNLFGILARLKLLLVKLKSIDMNVVNLERFGKLSTCSKISSTGFSFPLYKGYFIAWN